MTLEHLRPNVQPERMTGRAQAYLIIAGLRHLAIGLFCLLAPHTFKSPSFIPLRSLVPGGFIMWGVAGVTIGAACLYAACARSEGWARAALLGSAVVTGLWAGALWSAVALGTSSSPTGPIIWTAVTCKDLIICRQPMRSPFEPLVREVLARRRTREA